MCVCVQYVPRNLGGGWRHPMLALTLKVEESEALGGEQRLQTRRESGWASRSAAATAHPRPHLNKTAVSCVYRVQRGGRGPTNDYKSSRLQIAGRYYSRTFHAADSTSSSSHVFLEREEPREAPGIDSHHRREVVGQSIAKTPRRRFQPSRPGRTYIKFSLRSLSS